MIYTGDIILLTGRLSPPKKAWNIVALIFAIAFVSNGCAVVKKSYVATPYYKAATTELENAGKNKVPGTGKIYAGFSRVSITPDLSGKKVPIAGYGQAKTKYATGIHDSIFVRSVALSAGADTLLIISADMLIMPPDIADSVASYLARKGTGRDKLFFSATHTHSGIGGWGYGMLAKLMAGKPDDEIKKWITMQIVSSVDSSIRNMKPSQIGSGSFHEPAFVRNRLTGDNTMINDEFDYLLIEQEGNRRCVVGTYSAHATTTGRSNTLITGDYPGWWSYEMENGYASVAIFCGGSMGSQGPVSDSTEYDAAMQIGKSLADRIINSDSRTELTNKAFISYMTLPVDLPKYRIRVSKNLTLPSFLSRGLMAMPQNVFIQAIRVNNILWYFTPGDFSGEYALMLKRLYASKGLQVAVSGYNGAYTGYIIPGKYFYLDHYEPRTMSWFGPYYGDYVFEIMDRMGGILVTPIGFD
ncbi:MAG TPA: neutral/alkaline non-lysosomal ceramidase N-terminal domain-containing protein [Bacteroidales bacterium]|nr:neutral/alkaline non-lysosomal ceramidase N-terminal domain-containing protein [Bacteroidales bacterium]